MTEYPCEGCIVAGICKTACEKISLNTRDIIDERCCPDCGDENGWGYTTFGVRYIQCVTCGTLFYYSTYMEDMRRRTKNLTGTPLKGLPIYGENWDDKTKTTFGEYIDYYIKRIR
jgi:hypothetical protein